jgi:hypothetical protein
MLPRRRHASHAGSSGGVDFGGMNQRRSRAATMAWHSVPRSADASHDRTIIGRGAYRIRFGRSIAMVTRDHRP